MEQEEKSGRLAWFLMVIVVPLIFALTVFAIVLSMMGFNVKDEAANLGRSLPVLSSFFEGSEKASIVSKGTLDSEAQYASKQLKEQRSYIKRLEADLQKKEEETSSLKDELVKLKQKNEESSAAAELKKEGSLSALYGEMSAKQAAAVLVLLDSASAADILQSLETEKQADILSKMDPADAAEMTVLLAQ
ncbi:MotE family protein [Fictibacillus iocasae]|uniref:MotE family protein n=1 Tax=Fictibacillus iocasae TaxID=2715437 RepID=A0ABW2NVX0_9BACL